MAMRDGRDRANALSLVAQSVFQVVLQCALGLAGLGVGGLTAGYLAGLLLRQTMLTWGAAVPSDARPPLKGLLHVHRRWPLFAVPSGLMRLVAQFAPVLLVAALYGPAVAGLFGLGQRLLTVPIRVVGLAANQVFLVEAAAHGAGRRRLFERMVVGFALLGLSWALPLLFWAPSLFETAFGPDWRGAGDLVQLLVPYHLARFIAVPVSQTLNLLGRQGLDLVLSGLIFAAMLGAFGAGALLGLPPETTVALYGGGAGLAFALTLPVAWHHLKKSPDFDDLRDRPSPQR